MVWFDWSFGRLLFTYDLKDCWFRYESPAFLHFTLIWWYDFHMLGISSRPCRLLYNIIMICIFFSKVLGKIVRYFYAEVPSRQRPVGHWRIWGQKSPSEFFKLGGSDVDRRCTAASAACCAAWRRRRRQRSGSRSRNRRHFFSSESAKLFRPKSVLWATFVRWRAAARANARLCYVYPVHYT